MFRWIIREIEAVKERDPAARSTGEVLLGYPGIHALFFHRIAYYLNRLQDQINNWQFQLEQVENEVSCCDPKAI